MHKLNYLISLIFVILLPVSVILLSSNIVLRLPATYQYHFNDSEAIANVPYNITEEQTADSICAYWMATSDEPFQVYEDNRIFHDPVFEEPEQQVMKNAKKALNIQLLAGILAFAGFMCIYIYLFKKGYKKALRDRYKIGASLVCIGFILQGILLSLKFVREFFVNLLIETPLAEDSTLVAILGDPFYKTYLIFATVFGLAVFGFGTYIHMKVTKPERMFY